MEARSASATNAASPPEAGSASAFLQARDLDSLLASAEEWARRLFDVGALEWVWPDPAEPTTRRRGTRGTRRTTVNLPPPCTHASLSYVSNQSRPSGPVWDRYLLDLAHAAERLREIDRLKRAETLQRALFAIADLVGSGLDMSDMLKRLHEIVGGLMYAENFLIVLYDDQRDSMRFIYFVDSSDSDAPGPDDEFLARDIPNSLTLALIRLGRPVRGPSALVRKRLGVARDNSLGPESTDWLGVPLRDAERVRGAIVVQSYTRQARFSAEDQSLLAYVGRHILTALDRKQAHAELERRVEERTRALAAANRELTQEVVERKRGETLQAALYRIAELSASAESPQEFYHAAHETVGRLLDARNFFIALLTLDGTELEFPYSVDERDPRRPRRKLAKGLTEYVLRTGEALLLDREGIAELERRGEVSSFGTRSYCWLGVPLVSEGRIAGILALQSYTPEYGFTPRDRELLTFVALHIARALERWHAREALRKANLELEQRVQARTQELADAIDELRAQIVERERIESRLKHQATHDALTGLPNRGHLLHRLGVALSRCQHDSARSFAVLFLDLDRFKVVNDSVGHLVGDELLKEASRRIAGVLREPDTVARLGGDEFAILLERIHDVDDAVGVARRVIDVLAEPIRVAGKELFTSASIGIAVGRPSYRAAEELLRDADVAMYRAKALGRNRLEVFDQTLHAEAIRLLDLESDLRRAQSRGEFLPHFQPIVRIQNAETLGFEALLRWQHPQRGLLLPAEFLNVAEDNGSIEQIDWTLYAAALSKVSHLTRSGGYVSLNVSARHFRNGDLDARLLNLLDKHEVLPSRIRIEVTEGTLLENPDQVRRTLLALRDAGVYAQLDDFGTGYSSLSYLHQFPIHAVKIDRSFISDLRPGRAASGAAVVRAILALAHSLELQVIAEGIETELQREALLELGCQQGQGYLFARPQAADAHAPAH